MDAQKQNEKDDEKRKDDSPFYLSGGKRCLTGSVDSKEKDNSDECQRGAPEPKAMKKDNKMRDEEQMDEVRRRIYILFNSVPISFMLLKV